MKAIVSAVVLLLLASVAPAHADRALPASPDRPARPGPYGLQRTQVNAGQQVVDIGAAHKAEFTSEVTLPSGGRGPYPVVVFLHGAHSTCFRRDTADVVWPCPTGFRSVPSYQGYRYLADRLASQGFASVSISANGVNGQEDDFADGGTTARAELVDRHLRAIADAARGERSRYPRAVARRMDLSRLLLIGHSRGAAGVAALAAGNGAQSSSYRIRSVMSLAGILQVKLGVPQLPIVALLPQCDGDVFMLEGQNYIEVGSRLPRDRALRSAVWLPGGNHNFLNTQWTPGLSVAPSSNDAAVYNDWAGPCKKGKRISSREERAVARSYVAAVARATLRGEQSLTQFFDGSPIRPGDIGSIATRTTATGGRLLERQWRGSVRAQGVRADGVRGLPDAEQVGWNDTQTPHWLPALKFPGVSTRQRALRIDWDAPGVALNRLSRPRDISRADRLAMRVAVDTNEWRRGAMRLALRDARGVTALVPVPKAQLTQIGAGLPGHLWAQSVSVPVSAVRRVQPRLDLRRLTWLGLAPSAGRGRVWLLDAWAMPRIRQLSSDKRSGVMKASGYTTWRDGQYRVHIRMRANGQAAQTTTVRYKIYGYGVDGINARGEMVIPAGRRSVREVISVAGPYDDRLIVAVYPDRGSVSLQDYVWFFTRS